MQRASRASVLIALLGALFISLGTASAFAAPSGAPAPAGSRQPVLSAHQQKVLHRQFREDEIRALVSVSSPQEIQQLVTAIEDPAALAHSAGSASAPQGAFAVALAADDAPNGCSFSPDAWGSADFKPTCDRHDICYSTPSTTDRRDCDGTFRAGLREECLRAYGQTGARSRACLGVADVYYYAVRSAGWNFYEGQGRNN